MKILVTGGRTYSNVESLYRTLDDYLEDTPYGELKIIQGGGTGADHFARLWCEERQVPCVTYYAPWEQYGKSAGPMRNTTMLNKEHPDLVVACPGGRGTAHCVRVAQHMNIPIHWIP